MFHWFLELVFNRYKNDEYLDRTNIQGNFSIIGDEFINFISTVVTCCIIQTVRRCGLLEKFSYGDLMNDRSSAWKKVKASSESHADDGFWVNTLQCVFQEQKTKRGRKQSPKILRERNQSGLVGVYRKMVVNLSDYKSSTDWVTFI